MLDFGMLPPEVNSTLMYSGPGSGPMLAAASAWDALAWQLESFATGYSSTLSELLGQTWSGGSAEAMAAAATPYVAWASATATLAEQTANQARAAAAGYEAAFAATVPPPAVAANRVQLATLVATNFFGQNTAAIAATEAAYAAMWAQDATAMYSYAAVSSAASTLTPFQQPQQTTSATGQTGQAAAVAQAATATAAQPDPLSALVTSLLGGTDTFNTLANPARFTADSIRTAGQMGNYIMALIPAASSAAAKVPVAAVAAGEFGPATRSMVLAGVGQAAPVGGLSVPPSWPATPAGSSVQQAQLAAATHPLAAQEERSASSRRAHLAPAGAGPVRALGAGRKGYPVLRMRDRRYRMPRPAVGG